MKGLCDEFCPKKEAKMRIREKLVHFFEYKDEQKKIPGVLVKEFSRSAAGVRMPNLHNLRTEQCLQKTENYLITYIMLDRRKPYNIVYDFIFDRLRAIRQEMVIQDFNPLQTIKLLEPMIMFLAYSRYELCDNLANFDPKICEQHLQECLKWALTCYDSIDCKEMNKIQLKRRAYVESIYQVFNLGSIEPLQRANQLPKIIQEDETCSKAMGIGMHYYRGNFWRIFNHINGLPHIICAIAVVKIQIIRRQFLIIFSHAYNSKQLTVPIEFVAKMILMSPAELVQDCAHYNITIAKDRKTISFQKIDFKTDQTVCPLRKEKFIENKLKGIDLANVVLFDEF